MKKPPYKAISFSPFSEKSLLITVSLVTLLLQLISFATTWNGAEIYLGNIFPYASFLFAVAIQATAYFFSNSLRGKVNALKILSLCLAMCCSTYYSYIGIYNSVNTPEIYLQENYNRIRHDLEKIYTEQSEQMISNAQAFVGEASSHIIAKHSTLLGEKQNLLSCRAALSELTPSYAVSLRAPRQSDYENYEDYAAAYQIYISTVSQGKGTESALLKEQTLTAYGYTSIEQLNEAEQQNAAQLSALLTSLNVSDSDLLSAALSDLTGSLSAAVSRISTGQSLSADSGTKLEQLFRSASLCGYENVSFSQLTASLKQYAEIAGSDLLPAYENLVAALPDGQMTDAYAMELKVSMDAQIMNGIIKLNTLLPSDEQLSYIDPAYLITDLYLLPIQALVQTDTRLTAFFCLGMAALIDGLSVIFAISLRKKAPLWKRRFLPSGSPETYQNVIYAALPESASPARSLALFLQDCEPSPLTEADGYMLKRDVQGLADFKTLSALLCQLNLAKIIAPGFLENDTEILLLKARFVFWANDMISEERRVTYE